MIIDYRCDIKRAKRSTLRVVVARSVEDVRRACSGEYGKNIYLAIPMLEFTPPEQASIRAYCQTER